MVDKDKKITFREFLEQEGLSEGSINQYITQGRKFLDYPPRKSHKDSHNILLTGIKSTDREILNKAKVFCMGRKKIDKIKIIDGKKTIVTEEKDNRRVYIRRYMILKLLKYVGKEDLITEFLKITKELNRPMGRKKENLVKTISFKEFETLVKGLPEPYNIIVRVQFDSSMRISEVLNLTRDNIEKIDNERYKITTLQKGNSQVVGVLTTKTSSLLKEYANKNVKGTTATDTIFNLSYQEYEKNLVKYAKQLINKRFTSHFVKHMKSKFLIEVLNKNIFEVQKNLNHARLESTQRYFDDSSITKEKEAEEIEENISW